MINAQEIKEAINFNESHYNIAFPASEGNNTFDECVNEVVEQLKINDGSIDDAVEILEDMMEGK